MTCKHKIEVTMTRYKHALTGRPCSTSAMVTLDVAEVSVEFDSVSGKEDGGSSTVSTRYMTDCENGSRTQEFVMNYTVVCVPCAQVGMCHWNTYRACGDGCREVDAGAWGSARHHNVTTCVCTESTARVSAFQLILNAAQQLPRVAHKPSIHGDGQVAGPASCAFRPNWSQTGHHKRLQLRG